jgi:hypothetical protein
MVFLLWLIVTQHQRLRVDKQVPARQELQFPHVLGLEAFLSLHHLKFDPLALFQAPEAIPMNGAVMNKDIRLAFPGNEAKTLSIVKPLNRAAFPETLFHWLFSFLFSIKAISPAA